MEQLIAWVFILGIGSVVISLGGVFVYFLAFYQPGGHQSPYERGPLSLPSDWRWDDTEPGRVEEWRTYWTGLADAMETEYSINYRAEREREQQAAIAAQQEQQRLREAAETDFPSWLRSLGHDFGVTSYGDLSRLRLYVLALLDDGRAEFGGFPIKKMHQAQQERRIARPPNQSCETQRFFQELSRAGVQVGFIERGRGRNANTVSDDYHLYLSK